MPWLGVSFFCDSKFELISFVVNKLGIVTTKTIAANATEIAIINLKFKLN